MVKELVSIGPRFVYTGIWKGYSDNELKAMILQENTDIYSIFGEAFITDSRVVTRTLRRNEEESVVFAARLDIFKHIVKKWRINLDMATLFVAEDIMMPPQRRHTWGRTAGLLSKSALTEGPLGDTRS